jgi:hypothetical protein
MTRGKILYNMAWREKEKEFRKEREKKTLVIISEHTLDVERENIIELQLVLNHYFMLVK